MPSLAGSLALSMRSETGSDGQFDCAVLSSAVVRPDVPYTVVEQLLHAFDRLCAPCGGEVAQRALIELRAVTAKRADSDVAVEVQAVAYAGLLLEYPADIAVKVCREWPSLSRWWPAWHDLMLRLDRHNAPRQMIRRALRDAAP